MTATRGLPGKLPAGETLVWQGSPDWRVLAQYGFHVRKLVLYFVVLALAVAAVRLRGGQPPQAAALAGLWAVLAGAVPVGLVLAYAWAAARSTVYTVTSRRVVLRIGVAFPLTVNLPFACIDEAGVLARADGSGDIALRPQGRPPGGTPGRTALSYVMLWPHARPWHLARPEPMLRGLADVQGPAQLLARALAAASGQPAPVMAATPPAKPREAAAVAA